MVINIFRADLTNPNYVINTTSSTQYPQVTKNKYCTEENEWSLDVWLKN